MNPMKCQITGNPEKDGLIYITMPNLSNGLMTSFAKYIKGDR
jgi:hypothetical protein